MPALVKIISQQASVVRLISQPPSVVKIAAHGIQGPPGRNAIGSETFSWSPPSALQTWLIPHNMGRFPSVTITIDGEVRMAPFTYLDDNTISVSFAAPTMGTAHLN